MQASENKRPRVLLLHNFYKQPGGEDEVFRAEGALLEERGHEVFRYTRHNDSIGSGNRLSLARDTVWNRDVYRELRALIRRERPDVAHFHNTFPLISPAAYYAARAEGVAVVQTLHNYRLLCLNATLFRDGGVCEDCLKGPLLLPGVIHSCYRDNRQASAVAALSQNVHRTLGTWRKLVDVYIALTEFARQKMVSGSYVPSEKVVVKPNFLNGDPGPGRGEGAFFLFVGRLDRVKGVETLISAWKRLGTRVELKVVGDGDLSGFVRREADRLPGVEWLGLKGREEVLSLMKQARALVFPSLWYEGFPMVVVEAFASGLPVIASDLGGLSSLVEPGRTGLHFRPGDAADLARKVEWSVGNPHELAAMRRGARHVFKTSYTADENYGKLREVYAQARARGGERTN